MRARCSANINLTSWQSRESLVYCCERLLEVATRAELTFARAEAGPLRLGRHRRDARYWHISAHHDDLLPRLDSSQ